MFEKFGEFDSVEELNLAAEGFKKEGDISSLLALAEENGIDREDAGDYADGSLEELANPLMAALGKLKTECAELAPEEIMEDWVQYIQTECMESEEMARAVRRKGKALKGCIAKLLTWSLAHARPVDTEILKAAGVSGRCTLGIPGMGRARKIITEYYLDREAGE